MISCASAAFNGFARFRSQYHRPDNPTFVMEPLFSVIIPHRDIPDLLIRCLDSIPIRKEIQVIVVDDNSLGADSYLEKYPELSRPYLEFYCTTKVGGAGYARNIGLEHAKGKWLLFADADDFFVNDVYDIIVSHIESEADVIYFKRKAVFSDDIDRESDRDRRINDYVDYFVETGDDYLLRFKRHVPWSMMIKRSLVVEHSIRFDEVLYSDDVFFSTCVGFYAKNIEVSNTILYVVTFRQGSQCDDFCMKPGELEERARAAFRCDKFLSQHNMCRERFLKYFLLQMLGRDRRLFRYYYNKLDEIYPSKLSAFQDIARGKPMIFKLKLYIYFFILQVRNWIVLSPRFTM